MISAIKDTGQSPKWRIFCTTTSNSSSWGFDRLRLYYPHPRTRVAIFPSQFHSLFPDRKYGGEGYSANIYGNYISLLRPYEYITPPQPFHSGGGWTSNTYEHDFTFDLSWNTTNEEVHVCIESITKDTYFQQIYATPSGFSASRGKNAQITTLAMNPVQMIGNVGGADTSVKVEGQPLDDVRNPQALGKNLYFQNTLLDGLDVGRVLDGLDKGNITGGIFNFTGTPGDGGTTNDYWGPRGDTAKTNLEAKGWAIIGTMPTWTP